MDSPKFRAAAAAEAIAFLLHWSNGSRDKYSLLKMLYLSERKALEDNNWPIFFEESKCMKYGMVPQMTYDHIKGDLKHSEWDRYIETRGGRYALQLKAQARQDYLSDNHLNILREVFEANKDKDFAQLKRESHSLPEFQDPGASIISLDIRDIFRALNKSPAQIDDFEEGIQCEIFLERVFEDG